MFMSRGQQVLMNGVDVPVEPSLWLSFFRTFATSGRFLGSFSQHFFVRDHISGVS